MPSWAWIPIGIAIVLVVALIVTTLVSRRRTSRLRRRYGTEYDRAVQARDDRRAAEADLRDRQKQRARLDIRPLPEAARHRFAAEWRIVQEHFVDQPSNAVLAADSLVYRVMGARGYPMDDFETRANLVSVDYPAVVENYRSAHGIFDRAQTQQASTEDLRTALLHYRRLFDDLLQPQPGRDSVSAPAGRTVPSGSADAGYTKARHYEAGDNKAGDNDAEDDERSRTSRPRIGQRQGAGRQ